MKDERRLPRESPTWNRFFSAHRLRESLVVGGTLQARSSPPTKKSLASEIVKLTRIRMRQTSDDEDMGDAKKRD
ncbi:hypothetical protein C4D60_Mb07t23320 [Musa balbisiana]|uniref:Uncharacterized protein n=1 Tax=Musa balbisiana TaxID=52838 RepID=A0A4S8JJX5_MUSBA|nr:hypothetical protein C4D60_Mb07t23320 [Musa balbisiana]